ncbi:hypothetical protein FisN_20Lh179 [Fistulifera solaris]|uniref:SAP domain-containing protein n=1 Tax=Fistulifera solaris TaxID=1519565 RepID=A0A1Z5KRZ7_FISSO|nr:hypothetical protein FisN_20Lh179 [Fistulifera solaris]|eukprot:GAX28875.1 hypothetical protein FisN_20Lh179 [Fistulifera solaris]
MRARNKNSDLEAASAIVNGLHNESVAFSHRLDTLTMNISSLMKKRLEESKQKILSSSGTKRTHPGMKPTDRSSIVRSPVYKKQKATTPCESLSESEDFDSFVKRIKAMRKAELVAALESRGLCSIGKKDDLVNRLVDDFLTHQTQSKQAKMSSDPATKVSDGHDPVQSVMNRKDSTIMTDVKVVEHPMLEISSPNIKRQGIPEKKPVSVLKQMFESKAYKANLKETAMEDAKENSPTQLEKDIKEPKSPIRTFKAAMNTALSVLSIEKHRVISSSPKSADASRPLSPKFQHSTLSREPQQDAIGSHGRIPVGYLSASKVGSVSALNAFKASKTSYLQAGQARMAFNFEKQREMREQSKPIPSKSLYTPTQLPALSSAPDTEHDMKRKQKLAEIRAAAAEKTLKPGPVLDAYKAQKELASQALANSAVKVVSSQKSTFRSLLASPDASCQYEISDKEDTDSESESDDECNKNLKKIPAWAGSQKLQEKLKKQLQPGGIDPDEIFGEVETCDLVAIFDNPRTRFKKRTSSGNWGKDRATMAEKLAYKRRMQYSTVTIA